MRIFSFFQQGHEVLPVEVEVKLWPGLPEIKIGGLPDQHLKESTLRIKSALKAQGFQFPVARQILVQLHPAHIKKSSQGLELAIAAAFIWESGQAKPPSEAKDLWIYGGLNLNGQVLPIECPSVADSMSEAIFAGACPPLSGPELNEGIRFWRIEKLYDLLQAPEPIPRISYERKWIRPKVSASVFSAEEAEFLKLAVISSAHCLLAGPAGAGKSTLARTIHQLSPPVDSNETADIPFTEDWRPLIAPHHSIPPASFIGGGNSPHGGEIFRAHRGVLLLDELLEFKSPCLEALREPMENGRMRVARNTSVKTFHSLFQTLATTNLCPCGDFVPGRPKPYCRFSLNRCRSVAQRLSGPLADRFDILFYVHAQSAKRPKEFSTEQILTELNSDFFLNQSKREKMQRLRQRDFSPKGSPLAEEELAALNCTERRRVAIRRIGFTLAMLSNEEEMSLPIYRRALDWCYHPFKQLERWDQVH